MPRRAKPPGSSSSTQPLRQIGLRVPPEIVDLLDRLRVKHGQDLGFVLPVSQSDEVTRLIREAAERAGLIPPKKK